MIFAFKSGEGAHVNSFELGQHGRYRTNVWRYRGVNTLKAGRLDELALHPTVKPVALIADAIKDVSKRDGLVLDPFGGNGSTLIAAHKTGRRARLAELDPLYVDAIVRRWQDFAKDDAVLDATGETFDEAARVRDASTIAASPAAIMPEKRTPSLKPPLTLRVDRGARPRSADSETRRRSDAPGDANG